MTCRAFDQGTVSSNHLPGGTEAKLSVLAAGTRSSMMIWTMAEPTLIDRAAREHLGMINPTPQDTVAVRP